MKTLLVAAALLIVAPAAALACDGCNEKDHAQQHAAAGTPTATPLPPLAPGEARLTIPVSGMHCDHCASRVQAALTKVEGVKAATADLGKRQAVVTFAKGKVDTAKLVAAIDAAGFEAGKPVEN